LFLRSTVAEMTEIVVDLAAKAPDRQFPAAAFWDRLDNGRKVAIQILEFLDRHDVTLRRGDLRRINNQRLELFGRSWMGSRHCQMQEGNRPRCGVRTSNPAGAASRSLVGSTPTLFRQKRGAANSCMPPRLAWRNELIQ